MNTTTKWKFQAPSLSFFLFLFSSFSLICFPIPFVRQLLNTAKKKNLHWIAQFLFLLLLLYSVCICCVYVYHDVLSAAFSRFFYILLLHNWCSSYCRNRTIAYNKVKRSFRLKNIRVVIRTEKIPQKLL